MIPPNPVQLGFGEVVVGVVTGCWLGVLDVVGVGDGAVVIGIRFVCGYMKPIRESPDSVPGEGMEKSNAPRGDDGVDDCRVVCWVTAIIGISPVSTKAVAESWTVSITEGS
jgi:hypothetical protein